MNIMNCVPGMRVKILSKSEGMEMWRLHYSETKIDKILEERPDIVVDVVGNYFLSHDLEPIWREGNK